MNMININFQSNILNNFSNKNINSKNILVKSYFNQPINDIFISNNLSFGKHKEKVQSQTQPTFIDRVKNFYRDKGFLEISNLPSIFKKIETKSEMDYLEYFFERYKNNINHNVLDNVASELKNFRKANKRPMNEEELKIFDELSYGLIYRSKCDEMRYEGDVLFELVELAKDSNNKKDIINLLENKFDLYDLYDESWGWSFYRRNKEENDNFGKAIGKVLRYKEQNSDIADLIIPFSTQYSSKAKNYRDIKEFFDYYKKENKPKELLTLTKNPDFDFQKAKNIYEKYILNSSDLGKVLEKKLDTEPFEFLKLIMKYTGEYPNLKETLKNNLELSDMIETVSDYDFVATNNKILEKIDNLTSSNPIIRKILSVLSMDYTIDWNNLIANNISKEEMNEKLQTLYEALSTIQRLPSRKNAYTAPWAMRCKTVIDCISERIKSYPDFDTILEESKNLYKTIFTSENLEKRGDRRTYPHSITTYAIFNYGEYKERYDKMAGTSVPSPYPDMELCKFKKNNGNIGMIISADVKFVDNMLNHAKNNYNKIIEYVKLKSSGHQFSHDELNDIDNNIAEIHYLLSHAVPYKRGTAGIANILTRSLYKSLGIILPPTRFRVGLDLEAFCTPLAEYKNKWHSYFDDFPKYNKL